MADVAVIGAGALGMAGARRLALGGARVTVFEREPQPGRPDRRLQGRRRTGSTSSITTCSGPTDA